jgi:glycosyltransferase involved in cell wall biosynthesis
LMYHGSIVPRHGLDLAIEALGHVRKIIPNAELRICGSPTPFWETISQWPENALQGVSYLGHKTLEEIVDVIDQCDLGIIPNRKNTFTEINTPTRIFEYLSRGKPVIAPCSQGVTSYFGPSDLLFFALGDVKDLTDKIIHAYFHPEEVKEIVERGQEVYLDHKWSAEKRRFLRLIEKLVVSKASGPSQPRPQKVIAAKAGVRSL